jgi:ABC-type sulfate transport system permease subunit
MQLTRLRDHCPDTDSCPTIYWTDRSTALVQGYVVTDPEALGAPSLAADETAVEVPLTLLAGLTISGPALHRTDRGTVLVRGAAVSDPEALATLRLPVGETAVEVPLGLLVGLIIEEVAA